MSFFGEVAGFDHAALRKSVSDMVFVLKILRNISKQLLGENSVIFDGFKLCCF